MTRLATHIVVPVSRNRPQAARISADIVVSHLTVTWRSLPGLMMLRAQLAHTPLIHIEHSYCAGFAAANVRAPARFRTLLRTAYALFDRIIAVSTAQAEWLTQRDLVSDDRLSVIRPSVDLRPFHGLSRPTPNGKTIGAIGRLDRQKGFDVLIKAVRALSDPDLRLVIYGEGPEESALRALAAGDPRIRFAGFATDPVAAMACCDIVAMPSRWEPFGIVALEAAAAGRTLLVSPVDGLRDHVTMGATAVRDTSIEGWATAIDKASQPDAAPAMRDAALETVAGWRTLIETACIALPRSEQAA